MLFLQFQLGADRFALDTGRVVEVLPLLELRRLPQAPSAVAGVFNYRGQPVPALDLCQLLLQRPAREALSTRLIVVRCPAAAAPPPLLGLIAEQATAVFHRDPHEFRSPGLDLGATPGCGAVAADDDGLIQWIDPDRLLPDTVRETLLNQTRTLPNAEDERLMPADSP